MVGRVALCLSAQMLACAAAMGQDAAPNRLAFVSGEKDGGWRRWSPRPALAPAFRTEGRRLVLDGQGRESVLGGWRRTLKGLQAGTFYRVRVEARIDGARSAREALSVLVAWRGAGVGPELAPDDVTLAASGTAQPTNGASVVFERVLEAPLGASEAEVSLLLQWEKQAVVRFDEPSFVSVPAPPARRVRIATAYWRPLEASTPEANVRSFAALLDRAGAHRPDVVVLPEALTSIGTGLSAYAAGQAPEGAAFHALAEAARRLHTYVVYGAYERQGDIVYNSAHVVGRDGRRVRSYRKVQLPVGEVEAGLSPGDRYEAFDLDFGRAGILICHDAAFGEPARVLALQGAEVVFVPTWGGDLVQLRARALDNGLFVVTSGYDVPSAIIDRAGEVRSQVWQEPDGAVAFAEIELGRRARRPWVGDWGPAAVKQRRTGTYRGLLDP